MVDFKQPLSEQKESLKLITFFVRSAYKNDELLQFHGIVKVSGRAFEWKSGLN